MSFRLAMPGTIDQPGTTIRWLATFLHVPADDIVGCTEAEVADVEASAGRPLPLAYTRWLREVGRGTRSGVDVGEFRRAGMTYPRLLELRPLAREILEGWGDATLLERAFPFYNWEYDFTFLLDMSEASEDPPVLLLRADLQRVERCYPSFSDFILLQICRNADARAMSRDLGRK